MELINLLSEYSVDCIATAGFSSFAVFTVRKKFTLPEKANRLLPFAFSFMIYALLALFKVISTEEVISKSMTAGGLATVIYAFCGGYSLTKEEELKKLMSAILKTVVTENQVGKVTDQILQGLKGENDLQLIQIKISELIRANLSADATDEKIRAIATIFIKTYREFTAEQKT